MNNIRNFSNNKFNSIFYYSLCDKKSQDIAIYKLNKINKFICETFIRKKYIDKIYIKTFLLNEKCSLRNTFFKLILESIVSDKRIRFLKLNKPKFKTKNNFVLLLKELLHLAIKPLVYFIESSTYIIFKLFILNKVNYSKKKLLNIKKILFVYPDDEKNNLKKSRYSNKDISNLERISLGKTRYFLNYFSNFYNILVKNKKNNQYSLTLIDTLFKFIDINKLFFKITILYIHIIKDLISYFFKVLLSKRHKNIISIIEKRIIIYNNIIGGSLLRRLLISQSIKYLFTQTNQLEEISYPKEGAFWEKLLKQDIYKGKIIGKSISKIKILDCRNSSLKTFNEIKNNTKSDIEIKQVQCKSNYYFDQEKFKYVTFFFTGFEYLDNELLNDAILLKNYFSSIKINLRSHPDTNKKIIDKVKKYEKFFSLNKSWLESDLFFGSIYSSYIYSVSKNSTINGFIKINLNIMNIQPYLDPTLLDKYLHYENIREIIY